MTPAEFEQEAAFLGELEDFLREKGDEEGLLLAVKAHANLQLMLEPILDSSDEEIIEVLLPVQELTRERDELRALNQELAAELVETHPRIAELRAENERLQRENGALARMYALSEEKLRERTEALQTYVSRFKNVCDGETAAAMVRHADPDLSDALRLARAVVEAARKVDATYSPVHLGNPNGCRFELREALARFDAAVLARHICC